MSHRRVRAPSDVDHSAHLAARQRDWATPPEVVAAVVGEVTAAPVADLRRIVDGEQNEVYEVTNAPVIVRIAHGGSEGHDREAWVLAECAARGIPAPRVHAVRHVQVGGEPRSVMVMERLPGQRLADLDLDETDVHRVLHQVGAWLRRLHTIPVRGLGILDGSGAGRFVTVDQVLAHVATESTAFEEAALSVGLEVSAVRTWLGEIFRSLRAAPAPMTLSHNDLWSVHVLVQDGRLSGIIDFGVASAEPAVNDFALWDFREGERFPVQWIRDGYGDPSLFEPPHDRTYRALWLLHALWYLRHYHVTGFPPGVEAARDRLLNAPAR